MTRPTPFSHAFAELADPRFGEIQQDAVARGTAVSERAQFAKLPAVQRILADIDVPGLAAENPQAADEYLDTLFVAFRFWETGRLVLCVDQSRLQTAIESEPPGRLPLVPRGACYLQLPERWFWAQVGPDAVPEPVDGTYVITSRNGREFTVLAVLGLRRDRTGFSQLVVHATADEMLSAYREVRRPLFHPILDGGCEAGLKSLVSVAELLYLVQLALADSRQ